MTNEDIQKLVQLQNDIEQVEKALRIIRDKELEVTFPRYDTYYRLPLSMVENLRQNLCIELEEVFDVLDAQLKERLAQLTLCTREEEKPIYKPIDVI